MSSQRFLSLNNLTKYYEKHPVLSDVSFDIQEQEFVCFLGPSGCGKSTLLNIISGLISPDKGNVFFQGNEYTHLPPESRHFGMVFQNYALFPNLTVRDNITYGLRGREWSRKLRSKRADELLELIGLQTIGNRYPNELSGGQQQRVALARALAPSPQLLLLDEPFSALDAKVRVSLREEVHRIQQKLGVSMIMVTHDQEEAFAVADRIALMNNGRIEQVGTPEMLYYHPQTEFVAEFIGSMNVFSLPQWSQGNKIAVRYEHLIVQPATESTVNQLETGVFRVIKHQLMGAFYRLTLLHHDQKTLIYADVPYQEYQIKNLAQQALVAVTIPEDMQCKF